MILITNNAHTHPPDRFAAKTAEMITPIDDAASAERRDLAYRFRETLAVVLEPFFAEIDRNEYAACEADPQRMTQPLTGGQLVARKAFAKLLACARGTPWEGHWSDPVVQDQLLAQIASHFMTAQDLQRGKYRADKASI